MPHRIVRIFERLLCRLLPADGRHLHVAIHGTEAA
jgi:hypothetical protein